MANNFKNAFATSVSTSSGSPTDVYTSNNGSAVNDPDLANYSNTNSKFVESDDTGITASMVTNMVVMSASEYTALGTKDSNTLYLLY